MNSTISADAKVTVARKPTQSISGLANRTNGTNTIGPCHKHNRSWMWMLSQEWMYECLHTCDECFTWCTPAASKSISASSQPYNSMT